MDTSPTTGRTLVAILLGLLPFLLAVGLLIQLAPPPEPAAMGSSEPPEQRRVLRFGRTPHVSARQAYQIYGEFVELLAQELECCDVELVLASNYAACVDMLANREIDIAWLGTVSYVEHRDRVPMKPLVSPIWSGRKGYRGVLFTVEGNGIENLDQIRGRRVAFVDRESASGYIYPAQLLARAGLDLDRDFASVDFLGSHDAVLMAVLLGEYDVGAIFDGAYMTVADRARRMRLRVLAQTDPIPGEPIVAGGHLDDQTARAVQNAFLHIKTDRLAGTQLNDLFGFETVTDAQYDTVSAKVGQ